jgi:hypothetical protein
MDWDNEDATLKHVAALVKLQPAILNVELSRSIFPFSFFLFPSFRGASATNNEKLRMKRKNFDPHGELLN